MTPPTDADRMAAYYALQESADLMKRLAATDEYQRWAEIAQAEIADLTLKVLHTSVENFEYLKGFREGALAIAGLVGRTIQAADLHREARRQQEARTPPNPIPFPTGKRD